eukprot:CAMPEP_0179113968 /NCGR_PEP_ID=MMETSP0796-20121207/53343_1 /TAXON_ID=73915 /ORGANISM="Pyrodinium bahamense, Strain pbaha01" /LENGTH=100 /DNA_ID=CAMNT_0020812175 /DNA_START=369 /DNA_END=668 /DNA_ORIENTATION=+
MGLDIFELCFDLCVAACGLGGRWPCADGPALGAAATSAAATAPGGRPRQQRRALCSRPPASASEPAQAAVARRRCAEAPLRRRGCFRKGTWTAERAFFFK